MSQKLLLMNAIVLSLLFASSSLQDSRYNVTLFSRHSGLYYNYLGNALVTDSQTSLISHIDVGDIFTHYDVLVRMYTTTLGTCEVKSDYARRICRAALTTVKYRMDSARKKVETLKRYTGEDSRSGSERELFGGVPQGFHWLSPPDAEDAEVYDEAIRRILNGNKETRIVVKKQVAIVSSAAADFNNFVQNLKTAEERLNKNLELFDKFSKPLKALSAVNVTDEIELREAAASHIRELEQVIGAIEEEIVGVISSVLFARKHILHPRFMTPDRLFIELSKAKLEESHILPLSPKFENIGKYLELIKLNIICGHRLLLFAIKVPLAKNMQFNLYRIYPLPIPHNFSNLYSYIIPSQPYLLMTASETAYAQTDNLEDCTRTGPGDYICRVKILDHVTDNSTCEVLLLTGVVARIPRQCNRQTAMTEWEIWEPLGNNRWLFVVSQPVQATLSCDDSNLEEVKLNGTGVLELDPKCRWYTQNAVLEGSPERTIDYYSKIPGINMTDDCCADERIDRDMAPVILGPVKINNLKLNDLIYADENEFTERMHESFENHRTSWSVPFLYTAGFIAFIALVVILLKCFNHYECSEPVEEIPELKHYRV